MSHLINHCAHGMGNPLACIECMEEGAVRPPVPFMPVAEHWILASHEGRCARKYAHRVEITDPIGYVEGIGWCCEGCAR